MFSKHFSEVSLSNFPRTVRQAEDDGDRVGEKKDGNSPHRFLKRLSSRFWRFSLYYGTRLSASPYRPENDAIAGSPPTERSG